MIPYIALLIVLIVAILFTVYKQSEDFTVDLAPITITQNTGAKDVMVFAQKILDLMNTFKQRLTAVGTKTLDFTDDQKNLLFTGTPPPLPDTVKTTDDLRQQITKIQTMATMAMGFAQQQIMTMNIDVNNSSVGNVLLSVNPNATDEQSAKMLADANTQIQKILTIITTLDEVVSKLETPATSNTTTTNTTTTNTMTTSPSAPATSAGSVDFAAPPPETTQTPSMQDTKHYRFSYGHPVVGNAENGPNGRLVTFNVDDLVSAFGPLAKNFKGAKQMTQEEAVMGNGNGSIAASPPTSDMTASKVTHVAESSAAPVNTSVNLSDETINRLSKSLASQLTQQNYSTRTMYNPQNEMGSSNPYSDAVAQGSDYTNTRPVQQQPFDRNEYIRKDSIPCWGCSLPA
jgi:hypothetical protein